MADENQGESGPGITPSELDESTHAELRVLYQDSGNSVRFARERQWKLVGGTLHSFQKVTLQSSSISMARQSAQSEPMALNS